MPYNLPNPFLPKQSNKDQPLFVNQKPVLQQSRAEPILPKKESLWQKQMLKMSGILGAGTVLGTGLASLLPSNASVNKKATLEPEINQSPAEANFEPAVENVVPASVSANETSDVGILGRVEHWNSWSKQQPEAYNSLRNAAEDVEKETGVPAELLIDISGIETSGGQFLKQISGGPGKGYFQFEMPLPNDIKKIADRLFGGNFDPFDAYQSTRLAGELIKNKQLSRWGNIGGKWGSIDNQNRKESERLSTYYSEEELSKYFK
jgi:hypothetical protein